MLELGGKFLISYFIGSLMGAMIIGRLRGGVDIRTMGSGNAGGTNALRTQGWVFALGVMIIDVGKGAIAAGVVPSMGLPFLVADPQVSRTWLVLACAGAAIIGHVWPIWHRFRGGKGAATAIGTLTVLAPGLIIPIILVWASVLTLSGYVGLSTIIASASAPLYLLATRWPQAQPLLIFCSMLALFMIFTHRSNIARMRDGTEVRNERLMIFRKSGR